MQAIEPKVNINVQFGSDDSNDVNLGKVTLRNHQSQTSVAQAIQKASFKQPLDENYFFILLKYLVHNGREQQGKKYLQVGLKQQIQKSLMSPLQFICRQLGQQQISIYTQPGAVVVQYKISTSDQQTKQLMDYMTKYHQHQVFAEIKGHVSHTVKNRTSVKVNYSKFSFISDHIDIPIVSQFMNIVGGIDEQILNNPFHSSLLKTRKIHLNLKFSNPRDIIKYYNKISEEKGQQISKQKNQFKYSVPNIFRQKVQGYAAYTNKLAVTAQLTHNGQQVFLRLLKVYFKALKRAFH